MKRLACRLLLSGIFLCCSLSISFAGEAGIFKTKFTDVYYSDRKDMDDFVWRIGGNRTDFATDRGFALNRIDRLVERVEAILDMQPKNFKVNIYLHRGLLDSERIAYYDHKTKSIHISVDYATDGVAAHEMAHAVINSHFARPLPGKMQEILTQYVDKNLWSDY